MDGLRHAHFMENIMADPITLTVVGAGIKYFGALAFDPTVLSTVAAKVATAATPVVASAAKVLAYVGIDFVHAPVRAAVQVLTLGTSMYYSWKRFDHTRKKEHALSRKAGCRAAYSIAAQFVTNGLFFDAGDQRSLDFMAGGVMGIMAGRSHLAYHVAKERVERYLSTRPRLKWLAQKQVIGAAAIGIGITYAGGKIAYSSFFDNGSIVTGLMQAFIPVTSSILISVTDMTDNTFVRAICLGAAGLEQMALGLFSAQALSLAGKNIFDIFNSWTALRTEEGQRGVQIAWTGAKYAFNNPITAAGEASSYVYRSIKHAGHEVFTRISRKILKPAPSAKASADTAPEPEERDADGGTVIVASRVKQLGRQ
jgi:hypothetical protein